MASDLLKSEHLVAYDYGTGAVWAIVMARSPAEITDSYPQLTVYESLPAWMSDKQYLDIRKRGVVDIENGIVPEWMKLSNNE